MPARSEAVDKSTQLDGIAADAAPPPDYPPGCPALRPVLGLPRAARADYYEAMARVSALQSSATGLGAPGGQDRPMEVQLSEVADMMRLLAAIEDLLAVVAVDAAALRAWALTADDAVIAAAFNAYIARTQPGEVSSSAS